MPEPPHELPFSPLEFARAYHAYRDESSKILFPDTRLLAAARFWLKHRSALGHPAVMTFWSEDCPELVPGLNLVDFDDLTPTELTEIAAFLSALEPLIPEDLEQLTTSKNRARESEARQWLYLGEAAKSAAALGTTGIDVPALDLIQAIDQADVAGNVWDLLSSLQSRFQETHHAFVSWLTRFRAAFAPDVIRQPSVSANCLLVEFDLFNRPVRGRLRRLIGRVRPLGRDSTKNEVIFHHQIRSMDEQFYSAIDCALNVLHRKTQRGRSASNHADYLQGRFDFDQNHSAQLSGDSIGLAAYAIAHTSWTSLDLRRLQESVSESAAFTGAIEADGSVSPVAEDSLKQKIERVFRSSITHIVVPVTNRAAAEREVEALRQQYPRRRLSVVAVEHVEAILADQNIIRRYPRGILEYSTLRVRRAARSLKVQVPLFVALLGILGWLVFPTLRAVLDTNPSQVHQTRRGFEVRNRYGHVLWQKEYLFDSLSLNLPYAVHDLDADGKNEVLLYACGRTQSPDNAKVDVFEFDGRLRFRLDPTIPCQYPGDCDENVVYESGMLRVVETTGKPVIVTGANQHNPSRYHIRTWSATGDSLGWYINAGVCGFGTVQDFDGDGIEDIYLGVYNIRMRAAALLVIRAAGSYGVSPPYRDPQYDLSTVILGNQLHYMIFPMTDVTHAEGDVLYNAVRGFYDVSTDGLRFDVAEGGRNDKDWTVNYYLDRSLHVSRVDVDDSFKARRETLVREGRLPAIPWPEYFKRLQDTVTYWTNGKWVTDASL
jgi:hypothetical protein